MKRFFLLLLLVIVTSVKTYSQQQNTVAVVLKNGTTITGQVKQFDPTTKIVINVGGFDMTINMSDVNSVTNVTSSTEGKTINEETAMPVVNLPEDTVINICGVDVKFVLMKGGKFKYGFDGRGSLSMKSEPVHDVILYPYYVSEEFVSRDLYKAVMKKVYPSDFPIEYKDKKFNDESLQKCAFFMSENLSKIKGEEFMCTLQNSFSNEIDIPTEVQWYYYESKKSREASRLKKPTLLFCEFALKVSMSDLHDPVGQSIVVKGSTKHDDDDEFDSYRLYDRAQTNLTNITAGVGKLKFFVNKKATTTWPVLCPIRLVMPVKQ